MRNSYNNVHRQLQAYENRKGVSCGVQTPTWPMNSASVQTDYVSIIQNEAPLPDWGVAKPPEAEAAPTEEEEEEGEVKV